MQMTPQESAVGPTPSLPSVRTLFAAIPNEVLLELLGARSMHTENERCWRGLNPGPRVIGALAMGYDDTDPGRVTLWSPSAKARLPLDMLIQRRQKMHVIHTFGKERIKRLPGIELGHRAAGVIYLRAC